MRLSFQQVKKKIESMVPSGIDYDVDLEAASIAIVTNNPEAFSGTDSRAKLPNQSNVESRCPSASIMMGAEDAEKKIIEMLPAEAGLKRVYFDGAICECTIVCEDPGVAVGPKGATVRAIRDEIGWIVRTERFAALRVEPCTISASIVKRMQMIVKLCYASLALEFTALNARVNLGADSPPWVHTGKWAVRCIW